MRRTAETQANETWKLLGYNNPHPSGKNPTPLANQGSKPLFASIVLVSMLYASLSLWRHVRYSRCLCGQYFWLLFFDFSALSLNKAFFVFTAFQFLDMQIYTPIPWAFGSMLAIPDSGYKHKPQQGSTTWRQNWYTKMYDIFQRKSNNANPSNLYNIQ